MKPIEFAQQLLHNAHTAAPVGISLLDTDFYKLLMQQYIFRHHPNEQVTFEYIVRDKAAPIAQYVSEEMLRDSLDHMRSLRFGGDDLSYLKGVVVEGQRIFRDDYLEYLSGYRLPPYQLVKSDDQIKLRFSGDWGGSSGWEIHGLEIVSELYYRALLQNVPEDELADVFAHAMDRIRDKHSELQRHPNIRYTDFGTRRRHSFVWQDWVVEQSKKATPEQLTGTSNVYLARKHGLVPTGTDAHERPMTLVALADSEEEMRQVPYRLLKDWESMYPERLRIMLPDAYTSEAFFANAPEWLAKWRGSRQDSGDPIAYGELYIKWLERNGANPKDKTVIFSDGLDVDPMVELEEHFRGRINTGFGWGTLLTNDFRYCYAGDDDLVRQFLRPVSMVCKVVEVNGRPCVKLSDNPNKATGPADEVERYKRVFGVGEQTAQAVIV